MGVISKARVTAWRNDEDSLFISAEAEHSIHVSAAALQRASHTLAKSLTGIRYAINLCQDRYLFSVAFCAVISKGACNLLAQNSAMATQKRLLQDYPDTIILHDGQVELFPGAKTINVSDIDLVSSQEFALPSILDNQLCAIVYTSGSTGEPKANYKYWSTLVEGSCANFRNMRIPSNSTLLATVPPQHMWGLETSVLLPLFNRMSALSSRPFFPQDVADQLSLMSSPRVMVSTPVHLRSIINSGVDLPSVEYVLCATAPLSKELAIDVERAFGGTLIEVYGCSEIGSMAVRQTVRKRSWTLFDNLNPHKGGNGNDWISADHLPEPAPMQDRVQWLRKREFELEGRGDDALEVAGKRGSLRELNQILLSMPDVEDGVIFLPPASPNACQGVLRPAAYVVSKIRITREDVYKYFSDFVDPVFVPRPVVQIECIPRNDTGKVLRSTLLEHWSKR